MNERSAGEAQDNLPLTMLPLEIDPLLDFYKDSTTNMRHVEAQRQLVAGFFVALAVGSLLLRER